MTVGERLIEAAKEAVAIARGEVEPSSVYIPPIHQSHMTMPEYKYQEQNHQSGVGGAFEAVVPRSLKLVDKD